MTIENDLPKSDLEPIAQSPAPAADAQNADIPAATDETAKAEVVETPEQQEAKKQSRRARKLERERDARVRAETRAEIAERRAAELEARSAPKPQDSEPKREDFEDVFEYNRALAKHTATQATREVLETDRTERQTREQQAKATVSQEKIAREWTEREKSFQTEAKDYEEVVTPFVEEELGTLSHAGRAAIIESEVGPQLLYHLAQHPEVMESLADLTPTRQIIELGKLESKMAPAPKKPSTAPAPIKPVGQGKSASPALSGKESQSDYEAKRKSQGARWAR